MLKKQMPKFEKLDWKAFYWEDDPFTDIHFDCYVKWEGVYVSLDETINSDCTQSKEVEDGYTITQEWSVQDSAFVEVRTINYITITGTVETFEQKKSASVDLTYRVVDLSTSMLFYDDAVGGLNNWSNTYSITSGDSDALDGSCTSQVGFSQAFPGEDAMLNQAVDCAISRFYALIRKKLD
jgi:hypothetical protein